MILFRNRQDAGQQLANKLSSYKNNKDTLIIAIPRGGLVIGAELAKILHLPLDVFFSKKIGHPNNPEYAIGVVGLTEELIEESAPDDYLKKEIFKIRSELRTREQQYRKGFSSLEIEGKTIIITDDGVATGRTIALTIRLLKQQRPKQILVAIPVGPERALLYLKQFVDEVFFFKTPPYFFAISESYEDFQQVSDDEAIALLRKYHENPR